METLQQLVDGRQEYLARSAEGKRELYYKFYESYHEKLFEYADSIKNVNIQKIEIEDGKVIFTVLGCDENPIKMSVERNNPYAIPFTFFAYGNYEADDGKILFSLAKYTAQLTGGGYYI